MFLEKVVGSKNNIKYEVARGDGLGKYGQDFQLMWDYTWGVKPVGVNGLATYWRLIASSDGAALPRIYLPFTFKKKKYLKKCIWTSLFVYICALIFVFWTACTMINT